MISISKEYYSTMKNKDIMPVVTTWMKSEGILLSEISQMEKNTVDLICSEILKKKKKKKAKLVETESRIVVTSS